MPSTHRRHFGSARNLPSGRWQASYWHLGARHVAPYTLPTKADAQAGLSGVETDIKRGAWLDPEGAKVTLASWLHHWLGTVVDGRVGSDNTRANYAQIVRVHITPALGMVTLSELTAEMVDKFLAAKADEGLAKTHVSRMRTILADALRHAERRGLVIRNVAALAVMPRTKPPATRRSFGPDEAKAVIRAAQGERLEAMERGPDGRVSRGAVKRSKDGLRTLSLPPSVVDALRAHRRRQIEERLQAGPLWRDGELVFASSVGTPLDPSDLRRTFARIGKRAGIADYRHKVRPVSKAADRTEGLLSSVIPRASRT
jgi:integrase